MRVRLLPFSLAVTVAGVALAAVVPTVPPAAAATGSGPVNVLYAGSLTNLMGDFVGPAFQQATGYTLQGFAAGSDALASQIKGGIEKGDVFISASPKVNAELEGASNGNWVSWYATFATSPLVLGYNLYGPHAKAFKTKPWYKVITEKGVAVGRTDPATDPKGVLTVEALTRAASLYHLSALKAMATSTTDVFPEEAMVGRLQAGQLDAGFFYDVEAAAANIPTVGLGTRFPFHATYTISLLNQAPDERAAISFISFLLSKKGAQILSRAGLELTKVTVSGNKRDVPAALDTRLNVR
jgi:molybdate/tungstate transport system substrate-binding protein